MSSTFTPSSDIDPSKEKEWPTAIGMLDWDTTSIVFTKRTLIEFLKYTGTTVDTNFYNICKLPRYAQFGVLSEPVEGASNQGPAQVASAIESSSSTAATGGFKPTRRVREPPGGSHTNIFALADEDDALAQAPARPKVQHDEPAPAAAQPAEKEDSSGIPFTSSVKPSRRVREVPGGKDSLGNLWGGEDTSKEFKPTRRVREGPGGRDSINELF